jgi:hypothetical protein
MGRLTNDWTLSLDNSDDLNQLVQALKFWEEGSLDEMSETKIQIGRSDDSILDIHLIEMQLKSIIGFKFKLESILQIAAVKDKDGRDLFGESFLNYLQRLKIQSILKLEIEAQNLVDLSIIGNKTEQTILSILVAKFCRLNGYSFLIKS